MMEIVAGLDAWFASRLTDLDCRPETTAYIVGVLKEQSRMRSMSLVDRSIVLAFKDARERGDFAGYQTIGDWVLFLDVVMPDAIKHEREAIETIGRLAYYSCYRMMRQRWDVYEELADHLPALATRVRARIM